MTAVRGFRLLMLSVVAALAVLGGVIVAPLAAQAAPVNTLSGNAKDAVSGLPIAGLTVLLDDGTGVLPLSTTTDVFGIYTFAPPTDLTTYTVYVVGDDDHVSATDDVLFDDSDADTWWVPTMLLERGRAISGVIRDAATGLPVPDEIDPITAVHTPGAIAFALSDGTAEIYSDYLQYTRPAGTYRFTVPLGFDYELIAFSPDYDPQYWDHLNLSSCGCTLGDLITVTTAYPQAPITGVDFDLLAYGDWIHFSVLTLDKTGVTVKPGVLVMLDRKVGSGWSQIDSMTSGASGYADLYAFGPGDYRLRTTIGGSTGQIVAFDDYGAAGVLAANGRTLRFSGLTPSCGCSGFETVEVDLSMKTASSGGGSTPAPRSSHPAVAGIPAAETTESVVPTPTPTPVPTATPAPSPSVTPSDEPAPTSTATPHPVPASANDLWWVWLLIALLLLGIITAIVVLIRRR